MTISKINLRQAPIARDADDPEGYRIGYNRFGQSIGAAKLGGTIYELPPGQMLSPYHYEYGNEEWAIALTPGISVRHEGGEDVIEEGDVVCFPEGPDGAHQIVNRSDTTVRVLMISTQVAPSMAVYPDSDKILATPGGPWNRDRIRVRRESGVSYWDREPGIETE